MDELNKLIAGGVSLAYFWIVSGNNELLAKIDKDVHASQIIEVFIKSMKRG